MCIGAAIENGVTMPTWQTRTRRHFGLSSQPAGVRRSYSRTSSVICWHIWSRRPTLDTERACTGGYSESPTTTTT